MADKMVQEWITRIALTGVIWLSTKLFFVIIGQDFTWLFALFVAMLIVGMTKFAVHHVRG